MFAQQLRRVWKLVGAAFIGLVMLSGAGAAQADLIQFEVALSGDQEVGGGDPDGSGTAFLWIDDEALTVDWEFFVDNIDLPLLGAHIHNAPAGANGSVVVDFSAMLTGSGLFDEDLAAVLANPSNFYINLHTEAFPAGAIRGQLSAPVPLPASLPLFLLAGLMLVKPGLLQKQRRARNK